MATQSKASIFEIVSHESVAAVFKPAFNHVIKTLARKYPEKLNIVWKYVDEVYMICDLILQRYYLTYYNASVSENFYYLKRVDDSGSLSRTKQILSLITLVLTPYIKTKLDGLFERMRERVIYEEDNEQGRLAMFFLTIYPYVHFVLKIPVAAYQLGFILKLLSYHNPIFHLLKIQLVRAKKNGMVAVVPDNFNGSTPSYITWLLSLPNILLDKLIKLVSFGMPAVIFFLQFLEWWYSTGNTRTDIGTNLPIPPPPKSPSVSKEGCGLPEHQLLCPLCCKVRKNMAALTSSGFVFCYSCIYNYISQHNVCPVTQMETQLNQIIRIYSVQEN